MSWIRIS